MAEIDQRWGSHMDMWAFLEVRKPGDLDRQKGCPKVFIAETTAGAQQADITRWLKMGDGRGLTPSRP